MNTISQETSVQNSISGTGPEAVAGSVEATMHLIARLPVPEGLEDRVIGGLRTVPRTARILHWPAALGPTGSWMRGAAAAAIVFVVAGGGWGIYTSVQPTQPARVIVMPPRAGAGGGFSSAGAMRTPQTLSGPVVANPVAGQSEKDKAGNAQPAQVKPLKKAPAQIAPITNGRVHVIAGKNASSQPAVTAAK
jgi:hypothetical protein